MHYKEIIARVKLGNDRKQFERICIFMISHPNSNNDTFVLLDRWVRVGAADSGIDLFQPYIARLRRLGSDARSGRGYFTMVLDAVTPEIFDRARGGVDSPHQWDKYWRTTEWAAEVYGP